MKRKQHAVDCRVNSAWIRLANELEFESSTRTTPQFDRFFQMAKKWWEYFVKAHGYSDLELSKGHFYFSGFFTDDTGQVWYINSGDVRYKISKSLLIRTAKSYHDFTGGYNQLVPYGDQNLFAERLVQLIYKHHPNL